MLKQRSRRLTGGGAYDPLVAADLVRGPASLRSADRELILLRFVEGLEYHEIAEALRVPIGTVQWRVFHVKRKPATCFSGGW